MPQVQRLAASSRLPDLLLALFLTVLFRDVTGEGTGHLTQVHLLRYRSYCGMVEGADGSRLRVIHCQSHPSLFVAAVPSVPDLDLTKLTFFTDPSDLVPAHLNLVSLVVLSRVPFLSSARAKFGLCLSICRIDGPWLTSPYRLIRLSLSPPLRRRRSIPFGCPSPKVGVSPHSCHPSMPTGTVKATQAQHIISSRLDLST